MTTSMKNFLVAATLLGLAACANTQKSAVGSAETATVPTPCTSECSSGGECCAAKNEAKAKTECAGEVCPVTGQRATN